MLTLLFLGAFIAHFWEGETIKQPDEFQRDVVEFLEYVAEIK